MSGARARRMTPIFIVVALLAGLALPAAASLGGGSKKKPDPVARARSYWTADRLRSARPMPLPIATRSGSKAKWERISGRPGHVPSVAPRKPLSATRTESGSGTATEVPLADQRTQPLSTNGKVFFTDPLTGYNYVCSGTAVNSANRSVVWSAGHCLYDGGYFTNWVFVPAYRDGEAPFGVWPALELRVPLQWSATYNLRYDFGAAVVSPDASGTRLVDLVGGRGFSWNITREQTYDAYGYPAAPPFTGGRMRTCQSAYAGADNPPGLGPSTLGIVCDMTGGSSGGGWTVGDTLLSNVSYGKSNAPGKLYGPYFDDTAGLLYGDSSSSSAPDSVPTPAPSSSPNAGGGSTPTPNGSPAPAGSPTPVENPTPTPAASPTSSPDPPPVPSPSPEPSPATVFEITDLGPRPATFTPDGDGRKDLTRIRFKIDEFARTTVVVKRWGRVVATLMKSEFAQGKTVARWDGRKDSGRKVRRGLYIYVIKATALGGATDKVKGAVRVKR